MATQVIKGHVLWSQWKGYHRLGVTQKIFAVLDV